MTLAGLVAAPAAPDFPAWCAAVAGQLLNRTDLMVAGEPYRLAEVEAYYHGPGHADPFAHCDPVQLNRGRWYFHRTGGVYRGGSFKGLDFAFGDGTAAVGFLVRTVVAPDGSFVVGPSLTVDHLLARTFSPTVAALDAQIGARTVWDESSPLFVRESPEPRTQAVYATARVGLSLRRAAGNPDMPAYLMRPYRYLTEPQIPKGRPQTVVALHQHGGPAEGIRALSGVPKRTVAGYLAEYAAGLREPDFGPYVGKELNAAAVCRLLGKWTAVYGVSGPPV